MAQSLVIVPVMVSYDRIFEHHNLTSEMVKGQGQELSITEYIKRMHSFKKDQLGAVFVKYLEPIHVKDFINNKAGAKELDIGTQLQASFKLSQELYIRQQKETPVTLNSIVAAVLLQERNDTILMDEVIDRANTIYNYIKLKDNAFTLI